MFYKLKFENEDGLSIEFKAEKKNGVFIQPNSPADISFQGYKLIEFEDDMKADVRLQKSYNQDGGTHVGTSLGSRFPYLEFIIIAKDYDELSRLRRHAVKVFNPKLAVDIIKSQGRNIEKLTVIPEAVVNFGSEDAAGRTQIGTVSMVSPSSYWQDIEESKEDISTETGNFEFPLEIPAEGLELGIRTISFITNVYNQGDVETPIRVRLKATGTVENPIIENLDTGEFIRIKRTLLEGDALEINTAFGNKRVEVIKPDGSRENVFHYIDYKSTFFSLSGGDNTIKYDAEVGENNLDVSIYYTPNYLGI